MPLTAAGTCRLGVKVAQTVFLQGEIFRIALGKTLDELHHSQTVTVGDHDGGQTQTLKIDCI